MEGRLISNKKNGSKKTLNTDTIYAGDSAKILKDKNAPPKLVSKQKKT